MQDALFNLPKAIAKIQNPPIPAIKNVEGFDDLEGHGNDEILIQSNVFDIYTILEILPGQKLSGHTNTLTEASNLLNELYKRG